VRLPEGDTVPEAPWHDRFEESRNVLLFLGRIHPKKGLSELITGWERAKDSNPALMSDWALAIVGWDDGGYEAELRYQVHDAELEGDIHFLGPKFGRDKEASYQHADAFVLSSFSEGLPMAVLEAWSYALPVLMTPACNLEEGFEQRAALRTAPDPEAIARGLVRLFELTTGERRAIGRRGRALVEDTFTWSRVAEEMYDIYQWVRGEGTRPECVRLD